MKPRASIEDQRKEETRGDQRQTGVQGHHENSDREKAEDRKETTGRTCVGLYQSRKNRKGGKEGTRDEKEKGAER